MSVDLDINGRRGAFVAGSSLFEAAERLGVHLPTSCYKQGQCRECLVEVLEGGNLLGGRADAERHLTGRFRLACRAQLAGDRGHVRCRTLLRGNMRIVRGLTTHAADGFGGQPPFEPAVVRQGQRILRDGKLIQHGGGPIHGLAIDIGTTTVVINLVDLESGELVATSAFENPQRFAGSDVMSRILFARQDYDRMLQRSLVSYLVHAIEGLPCNPKSIYEAVVVGNSTMRDVFFGVDVQTLGQSPFRSRTEQAMGRRKHATTSLTATPEQLGLIIHRRARVWSLPLLGSHVGADAAACMLVTRMASEERIVAIMDIGTNTELIVGNKDRIVAASCPAGPAFEGGGLSCGMPALDGAIESIRIDDATGQVTYKVIGDQPPTGICGSGLVDLLSELMRTGRLLPTGRLAPGVPNPFVVDAEHGIVLTESDISRLAQAKAASVTGMQILMDRLGIGPADLQQLYLAGGFAQHLDLAAARRIGLVPNLDPSRMTQIGNAAVAGATLALRCVALRKQIEELARKVEHVELEADHGFFEHFVDGCQFVAPAADPLSLPNPAELMVSDAELARMVSWPKEVAFDERMAGLARGARRAFKAKAQPWMHVRQLDVSRVREDGIELPGGRFVEGRRLAEEASRCGAHSLIAFAGTVGPRIAAAAERLWNQDKPDEAFVLGSLCNAFVEEMIRASYQRICQWAQRHELAVLPPMSPGADGWELSAQHAVFGIITDDATLLEPPPLRVLDSGGLSPGSSQLAVFLLTRRMEFASEGAVFEPCARCSLRGCAYRRRGATDAVRVP